MARLQNLVQLLRKANRAEVLPPVYKARTTALQLGQLLTGHALKKRGVLSPQLRQLDFALLALRRDNAPPHGGLYLLVGGQIAELDLVTNGPRDFGKTLDFSPKMGAGS